MNGHERSCRCDKCRLELRIKILENTQERLLVRVAKLEQEIGTKITASPLKSVPDPEFDWGKVNAVEVHIGVSPPKTIPPMTVLQQVESDRAQDEFYFKERATLYIKNGQFVSREEYGTPTQPIVLGGEG